MQNTSLFLFALVVLGFGSAFSLTHVAVGTLPPLWVAAGRSLVALLGIGAFLVLRRRPVRLEMNQIRIYILIGILTGVAPYTLISWGQKYIPSSLGGVLFAASPLMTLMLGVALFKAPRPKPAALLGAAIGMTGVGLSFGSTSDLTGPFLFGALATLLAAASYALGSLILQRQRIADMVAFSAAQLVPATAMLFLIAWMADGPPVLNIAHGVSLALIALGLVGTCVPVLSLFHLVAREGAQAAALTTFFIPFAAVAIGVGLLGESFPPRAFIGLLAVVLGSVLIVRNQR